MDTINTLTINAGRLQPGERDRLFLGLVATRRLLNQTDSAAARFIEEAEKVGVRLSPADKAGQLLYARQLYGDCVHETSLQQIRRDVGQAPAPAEATAVP